MSDLEARAERKTVCNRDCPDVCSIVATVENGRVTRLRGDPDHPVTRGVESFACEDEAYAQMDLAAGVEVLARARARDDERGHPAVFVQEARFRGRTAYIALGHGASTFDHPAYRRLVSQAAGWCCRMSS